VLLTSRTPRVFIRRPPHYLGLLVYFPPISTSLPYIFRLSRNSTCLTLGTDRLYLRTRVSVQSQCRFPPFSSPLSCVIQSHFRVWSNSKTPDSLLTSRALLFRFKIDPLLSFAIHVLLISCPHFLGFLLRVSQIGFHEEFPNSNEFRVCPPLPFSPTHRLFIKSTPNLSIFCRSPFHSYLGQSASRTCVDRFVTRSGRIPPAFRIALSNLGILFSWT